MFTLGKHKDAFVILTDQAEACADLTRLTLDRADAEELARMLNFMLRPAAGGGTLTVPRIQDTERAPALPPEASTLDVIAEAMAGDSAEIERRKQAAEAERERRRVRMLGARAEDFISGEDE